MTRFFIAADDQGRDFFSPDIGFAADLAAGRPTVNRHELRGLDIGYCSIVTAPARVIPQGWPFRVFEVVPEDPEEVPRHLEPIGDMICHRMRVIDEVPVVDALGPQAQQIVAVLDRVRTVTLDEAQRMGPLFRLGENGDGVAGQAARDAGRRTWFPRMTGIGSGAVHKAATGAAQALLARDLLTEGPWWNRESYDSVTRPWRQVIGPIHPDDGD